MLVQTAYSPTPPSTPVADGVLVYDAIVDGGCVGDDSVFDTVALAAADAIALAAGKPLYLNVGRTYKVSGAVVISSPVIFSSSKIHVTAGSITFNNTVTANIQQILELGSGVTVAFNPKHTLVGYVEWLGGLTDDPLVDNTVPIQTLTEGVKKVQLMGGIYHMSGTIHFSTDTTFLQGRELVGVGTYSDTANWESSVGLTVGATQFVTIISCSSASATILKLSEYRYYPTAPVGQEGWGIKIKNLVVGRSVAPLISSNCEGIHFAGSFNTLEDVLVQDCMVGIAVRYSWHCYIRNCKEIRAVAGSGAGTDYHKGIWMDGRAISSTIAQGNIELSIYDLMLQTNTGIATGNSWGVYATESCQDNYLDLIVTNKCHYGMEIVGSNSVSGASHNMDFHCGKIVLDNCGGTPLKISNIDDASILQFASVFLSSGAGSTLPTLAISSCADSHIMITNLAVAGGNTNSASSVIEISNSSGVDIKGGAIAETMAKLVSITNSTGCKIDVTASNYHTVSGNGGVVVTNSSRNSFNVATTGYVAGSGYVVDVLSDYNEFNCTGLNPATITGGAANKLVINGTQVTVAGIAAAGAGHNVASGVMN